MDEVCEGSDWNPIASGSSHSQLAAVIAGFLFTGIILVLQERRVRSFHPHTIKLMVSSFLVLMLDSFFFSIIGGERTCARGWTEMMIAAGLLGVGSLGVFSALAWLTSDRQVEYNRPSSYISMLAYAIAAIVALRLSVTTRNYLHGIYAGNYPPQWLTVVAWVCPAAIVAAVGLIALTRWFKPRRPSDRAINRAAVSSVAYALASSACFGLLGGPGPRNADHPGTWVAAAAVLFALGLSTVGLILNALALPPLKIVTVDHKGNAPGRALRAPINAPRGPQRQDLP
jgi:hypothetical protein